MPSNMSSVHKQNRDDNLRRLDVGVDANGMAPASTEEILAFWDKEYSDALWADQTR